MADQTDVQNDSTKAATTTKLLVESKLISDNLNSLHSLISFDQAKTSFTARFPSPWKPLMPEQNELRKHPQHILADAQNLTKSWKYVHDTGGSNKANDNILIEIYLNKPIQIACIQIQLKFNRDLQSQYELCLLKKKAYEAQNNVDSPIDFKYAYTYSINESLLVCLTSDGFFISSLKTSALDTVFGPIDLRDYLDTGGTHTCTLTICSDKILHTRTNLYFISLKANNNDGPLANTDTGLLQTISITLRKYKKTCLKNERMERELMLKRPEFLKDLFDYLVECNDNDQLKVIDILSWILYNVHTSANMLHEFLQIFYDHLKRFLEISLLHGNRSTSRKAVMFLTFLLK
jgi:hypothetical protein